MDSLRGPPSKGCRTAARSAARRADLQPPPHRRAAPLLAEIAAAVAARAFARALKRRALVIGGAARARRTPPASLPLAGRSGDDGRVAPSPTPVGQPKRETLIKALGEAFGAGGRRAGAAVVRRTMAGFGCAAVADGSASRLQPHDAAPGGTAAPASPRPGRPGFEPRSRCGRRGTLDHRSPQRRARPLPGQAARSTPCRPGRLCSHGGRTRSVHLPHERRQRLWGASAAGAAWRALARYWPS